jgi:hypothetical protein
MLIERKRMIKVFARAPEGLACWEVDTDNYNEAIDTISALRGKEFVNGAVMAVVK